MTGTGALASLDENPNRGGGAISVQADNHSLQSVLQARYSIYLSTDCPRDLSAESFVHLRFEKAGPLPLDEELKPALGHPHQWFLTRRAYGGCSCHFRHSEYDPRFEPLQDWMPENEDDVLATREAYRVFRRLVADGYQLDLIDVSDLNQH